MKTYKQFNEAVFNSYETVEDKDIRSMFSNLKKLSYYFEDYYQFKKLINTIESKVKMKPQMSYFGVTNESMFVPIVNTVTVLLHDIFGLIVAGDYQKIYDFCNRTDGNKFESRIGLKGSYVTTKNHISMTLSNIFWYPDMKPFYRTKFKFNDYFSPQVDMKIVVPIIQRAVDSSKLQEKYKINVWHENNSVEINIINKGKVILTQEQREEITKAKEFGKEKYEKLLILSEESKELNDMYKNSDKYNL